MINQLQIRQIKEILSQGDHNFINFQNCVTYIKINRTNFIVCKQKILKILSSFNFKGYFTEDPPLKILVNGQINPEFKYQNKRDKMIGDGL